MKRFYNFSVFLIFLIFLQYQSYGQNLYFNFNYERPISTAVVVESQNIDSLTRRNKVVLNEEIPFYHFINDRNSNNSYVILLHGLGGSKEYWVNPSLPYLQYTKNLTAIKDSLLSLGFNLVIIDAKYHGERTYELNFRDPGSLPPVFSKNEADADIFYDLYISTIKEVQFIMDHLEDISRGPQPKFNLLGYSMGGAFSLILNSIDERIQSTVACVPPLSRPFSELENFNWSYEISEKMKAISPLYQSTNQKSPVAMLMGKTDPFITVEEAREFYNQIPLEDKTLKFYDSGHELPPNYINDVISWLIQHN